MNNLSTHRLLAEALGVLESEYEGTDCHKQLIEAIRKELEEQKIAEEYFEKIIVGMKHEKITTAEFTDCVNSKRQRSNLSK